MGLETKYYVDANGNYLGGFTEGNSAIPVGAIEIETPPEHGWQKWDGAWLPLTPDQLALLNG